MTSSPRTRAVAALLALLLSLAPGAAFANRVRDGDRAMSRGDLDGAMRNYQQAAREGSAEGQAGVGRVWLERGRIREAETAFKRALVMDPDLAAGYYGMAELKRRASGCEEAVPLFEKAVTLDRKYPEAQLAYGNCLVATGHFERGIAELEKGLKWGRVWEPRFLVARGNAWMSRDSLRKAGIDFTRAREIAPNDAEVRRAAGEFYIHRGTWALAIPELKTAVALDSSDAEARYSLARAQFFAQDYDDALATYRELTDRFPDFAPGLLGLGDLLYRAGAADARRYEEAKPPLERYVAVKPDDAKGWSLLGRTEYRLGERDSALAHMVRAEQLGETGKELYTTMGLAYSDLKRWDEALAAFQKGEPGPREDPIVAQIYDLTGHPAQADSIYLRMLARDSTSTGAGFAYQQRGKLRFRERDYPEAERLLARATTLDPRLGEAWFFRGLALKELNREDEALSALQQAAAVDSERADRFFWLGVLYDGRQQLDQAEKAFRRSTALDSTSQLAGKAYGQLGYYRLLKRSWSDAIPLLERATALDPKNAQAWLWLGQGYQNEGNRTRAAESYRRALAADPQNVAARQGMKSLGQSAPAEPREGSGETLAGDH